MAKKASNLFIIKYLLVALCCIADFKYVAANILDLNNTCTVSSLDTNTIINLLANGPELMEYQLNFSNYHANPLVTKQSRNYDSNTWQRVFSRHGRTLLSLPYNYELLSMSFLTVGVRYVLIQVQDAPEGCFGDLSEQQQLDVIVAAIFANFQDSSDQSESDNALDQSSSSAFNVEDVVCHQVIRSENNVAVFTHECCRFIQHTEKISCNDLDPNKWIELLYSLIQLMDVLFILFGPLLGLSFLYGTSRKRKQYTVQLENPVLKTVLKRQENVSQTSLHADAVFIDDDLENTSEEIFHDLNSLPYDRKVSVAMDTFAISVDHNKLLDEKSVNVGPLTFLWKNLVLCNIMKFEPFVTCCSQSIFGSWQGKFCGVRIPRNIGIINKMSDLNAQSNRAFSFGFIAQTVGVLLGVLLVPIAFYVRILIFKISEEEELKHRQEAAQHLNYAIEKETLELQLSQYKIVYIHTLAFVVYFIASLFILAIAALNRVKFQHFTTDVMQDFKHINRLESIRLLALHVVKPFEKFGLCGIVVAPFYWLVAIPVCLVIVMFYCIPTFYLTGRLLIHNRPDWLENVCAPKKGYETAPQSDVKVKSNFVPLTKISPRPNSPSLPPHKEKLFRYEKGMHLCVGIIIMIWMYSLLLLYSECFGFAIEVATLTLMGAAVHSGISGKFLILMFFVVAYTSTCFKRVTNKYQKLNTKIFEFIKAKLHAEVSNVVKTRGTEQKNVAFKYFSTAEVENYVKEKASPKARKLETISDMRYHEGSVVNVTHSYSDDFVAIGDTLHLNLHSLVFFIDNDDVARIPKELFDDIAKMKCPGCPGPVHRSLLSAVKDLLAMILFLCFFLIVVMAFGDAYQITTTNQMLLTLAGGLLPFIFKELLRPNNPNLQLNSYTIDGKIHEIIQDFHQTWPVSDINFKLPTPVKNYTIDRNLPNIYLGPVDSVFECDNVSRSFLDQQQPLLNSSGDVCSIQTDTMGVDLVFNVNKDASNLIESKDTTI